MRACKCDSAVAAEGGEFAYICADSKAHSLRSSRHKREACASAAGDQDGI